MSSTSAGILSSSTFSFEPTPRATRRRKPLACMYRCSGYPFPSIISPILSLSGQQTLGRPSQRACRSRGHIFKNGFDSDVFVLNSLISMYSDHGMVNSARQLLEENRQVVDTVSWNALIDGYLKCGSVEVVRQLFDDMPESNDVSWSTLMSGHARHGELGIANGLFDRMPYRNSVTWNAMISGLARIGLLPIGRKMFDEMPCKNAFSWNAMITAYAQSGDVDSACYLFDEIADKDVVSWSSMISGYTPHSRYTDAVSLFKRMLLEKDVKPNDVTLVSVLSASARVFEIDLVKWIHAYIDRCNIKLDDNLGTALVDMYAKCGNIKAAEQVFSNLERRNMSAWNVLVVGFAMHGIADESFKAFAGMQDANINPNNVTFLGVLTACSHAGLVDEGRQYFNSMLKDHNILPNLSTMVVWFICWVEQVYWKKQKS